VNSVFVASDNIITSLGFTTDENMTSLLAGKTGIKPCDENTLAPELFWASMVDNDRLDNTFSIFGDVTAFTRFEKMVICSVKEALNRTSINLTDNRTLLILSTTKGTIDLLNRTISPGFEDSRVYLWNTALLLQCFFKLHHTPIVVSNACISGVLAIMIGARLIRSGQYDNVIVSGADLVTEFVISGFNSFKSLCTGPCRPFDKDRQGLSLGEGAGTVVLTNDNRVIKENKKIGIGPGFSSNDANHISGPSRTGEGLYIALKKTLEQTERKIEYISAHGTATPYNDEMEALALTRANLQDIPVNSLKGYWGHTLGAAGLIESIACFHALRNNLLIKTLGFSQMGVTAPVAVVSENTTCVMDTCLKIASGFGGCNASIIFYK
jgi:3-oxoacyl-[acyl-carrier-protein] synthase-1